MTEHFIRKETNLTVADAAERVAQLAKENGFGVLNTLNLQAIMAGKGVDYKEGATVVEICRPADAKRMLELDQRAASLLPCRIAITTVHGRTVVHTMKPSSMVGLFKNKEVDKLAHEIDGAVETIIQAIP